MILKHQDSQELRGESERPEGRGSYHTVHFYVVNAGPQHGSDSLCVLFCFSGEVEGLLSPNVFV